MAARPTIVVPPAAERARRFLVLPFRNVTRHPDQEWLVEGSTTMLADALGRWEGITVVPDEKLYPALKRASITPGAVIDPPSVRRVAEETGGWTAVTGEVLATGGRLRVTARAWDVSTNREVVRAASEVPTDGDVRLAFDSVSLRLLRSVGLESVTSDLATTTTRDLNAYRAYLDGLAQERRTEVSRAIASYAEAVRRDSSFALAWARLAEMTLAAEPASLFNPMSKSAQYSARAVALSSRLPARQRDLLLANDARFRAQFDEARRLLEQLTASDSTDIDALVSLIGLETFDPLIVGAAGHERPRGSMNRAARLAKRVLELDPGRHGMFGLLASLYAGAGVPGTSPSLGVDRAPTSFADLIQMLQQREHYRVYISVLRDSLVLVPAESLSAIPKDTIRAMRRRARSAARSWAERWLAAAPGEAAPHQLASELYAFDGEFALALRELAAAESLGVQTPSWSAPARRLVFLGKSGDLTGAGRLADSLTQAGFFANPNSAIAAGDAAAWAFAMHLLRGHTLLANALMEQGIAQRKLFTPHAPTLDYTAFMLLMGNDDPEEEPGISRAFRARQLDSILPRASEWAATTPLGAWLPVMLPMIADAVDKSVLRSAGLLAVADRLVRGGQTSLGFQLASNAVASDSTLEPDAAAYPWYRTGAEALNAGRLRTVSRFHPSAATVSADRVVFEWRVDDADPFPRNRVETPVGRPEYRWDVTVEIAGRYYRFTAAAHVKSASSAAAAGTLADVLPLTAQRAVITGQVSPEGAKTDTTVMQGVALRTEIAPGVLRMIVTDPTIVRALRSARPERARFQFRPCVRPVGSLRMEQCVDERVAVAYP